MHSPDANNAWDRADAESTDPLAPFVVQIAHESQEIQRALVATCEAYRQTHHDTNMLSYVFALEAVLQHMRGHLKPSSPS